MIRKLIFIFILFIVITTFKLVLPSNVSANYWIHEFGDPNATDGASGVTTDGKSVYVVGNLANTNPGCSTFVKRYDLSGNELWSREYCTPMHDTYDVAVNNDSVFVAGREYLKKFDKDGNEIWTASISGSGTSVTPDANNNVYIGGTRYIYKFDQDGNQIWTYAYAVEESVDPYLAIKDGKLLVAGSYLIPSTGERGGIVQTFDLDGNLIWTKHILNQPFRTIALDENGNIYTGGTNGGAGGYIYKFDPDGNQVWQTFDGTDLKDIKSTNLGLYTVGRHASTTNTSAFFRHYDFNGNLLWTKMFGTNTTNPAGTNSEALAVDGTQFYIVGQTFGALPGQNSAGDIYPDAFIKACTEENCEPTHFFLHDGPIPFLNNSSPANPSLSIKNSTGVDFSNGNLWKEIGTWQANPAITRGNLQPLSDLKVWVGLKNHKDVSANFDLRAEIYKNTTLLTAGESRCITGLTTGVNFALRTYLVFPSFASTVFDGTTDILSLKILTRIGTNPDDTQCPGNTSASGLKIYFDSTNKPSEFGAVFIPF